MGLRCLPLHPRHQAGQTEGSTIHFPTPRRWGGLRLAGTRDLPLVARQAQLDSYIDLIVRHDLSDGSQRRTRSLKDWMRAYAASVSTCTTLDSINRSL